MGSSRKHCTEMFKSKSSDNQPNFHTSGRKSTTFSFGPKPRWNPMPEQIRILESIFNSGMVNPPREEIKKIGAQLQELGQVADSNVFYWFQNRKSRNKLKNRQQNSAKSTAAVHINGVKFEVCAIRPFCVQEAFGDDAMLFYQSGHPIPTNNLGATLQPLKHGASYIVKAISRKMK